MLSISISNTIGSMRSNIDAQAQRILMEESQLYPCFFPCTNKAEFEDLDTQACELLDFPNAGATDYCNPIIDKFGAYWFTVNPEVSTLVDLTKCVQYDEIQLPIPPTPSK